MALATSSARRWSGLTEVPDEPTPVMGPLEPRAKFGGAESVIEAGTLIGRYRIRARIGTGGVGVVYAAVDEALAREVALKLVRPGPCKPARLDRRHARLIREAQALARLGHPNVVAVHEVGQLDDRVYVAMEFVEGMTVRAWLRERPRPWADILAVFDQAGRGLAAAHAAGIVHRDFKPDNLLLGHDGRVRVVDFGLATACPSPEDDAPRARPHAVTEVEIASSASTSQQAIPCDSSSGWITGHGKILGTPAYMSPEQSRAEPVDARADQYSFCVSLWEALFGERPQGPVDLRRARADPSSRSPVPRSVLRALARGLRVDPDDRFADMPALLAALAWRAPQRRRRAWAALAAAVLLGAALGALATAIAIAQLPG
jgi:eukaryotic-like serine/threonine-protein kinase